MSKPITKALHTARVFARLSSHLANVKLPSGESFAAQLPSFKVGYICGVLGNVPPTDATLFAQLEAAVKEG